MLVPLEPEADLPAAGVEVEELDHVRDRWEHRLAELTRQAEEAGLRESVSYYLDFFRYGCPPHGGFGLGLARLVMLLLGLSSIREATFLHRGPTRLTP